MANFLIRCIIFVADPTRLEHEGILLRAFSPSHQQSPPFLEGFVDLLADSGF